MRCLYKVFGRQQQTCVTLKENKTNQRKYFLSFLLFCVPTSLLVGNSWGLFVVIQSHELECLFFFPFGQGIRASPSIMERDVKN